jgi:TetR/AcrR family transcriptional regulator, regulator of biofilm formation and stress response
MDAAVRVVARRGLHGLTYRAVAAEAGVTHGLVTHHFGTREVMIRETLSHAMQQAVEASFLATPVESVDEFAEGLADRIARTIDQHVFSYELGLEARRQPDMLDELRAVYDRYVSLISDQLKALGLRTNAGLDRLIFAALDGIVLQQVFFGARADTAGTVRALQALLQTLLSAQSTAGTSPFD